jgi:hypothetical protein
MMLLQAPEIEQVEAVLTVRDRAGRDLVKVAVDRSKQTGALAAELAELSGLPPAEYCLYSGGESGTRLDPTRTIDENLEGAREADLRLVSELTGN